MEKYIFSLLVFTLFSCAKYENIYQLKPLNTTIADATKTITVVDEVPTLIEKRDEVKTIVVPEKAGTEAYSMNEIIADSKIIPLETTEECLIGTISKICADKSLLVIFDKQNQSVFRFSNKGKFLGKIGKRGRGPLEYNKLTDVSVDKKQKEICLSDLATRKFLYYDYAGKFLREESMYFYSDQVEFTNERMILEANFAHNTMAPSLDYSKIIVSSKKDQQPLYKGFTYPEKLRGEFHWGKLRPLQKCNGKVYYTHVLSDTLWQIENDQCIARYTLKFPERKALFTENELKYMTDELYESKIKQHRSPLATCLITKDFLILDIGKNGQAIPLLYCISSGHIKYNQPILKYEYSSKNDLIPFLHKGKFDFTINDTQFVTIVQPFDVYRDKKRYEESGFRIPKETSNFIDKINQEDNPILVISTLKKF